jgi:hypothetical protein
MCTVSNITDYGQRKVWPNPDDWKHVWPVVTPQEPYRSPPRPFPRTIPLKIEPNPFTSEEVQKIKDFLKLIEAAEEFDKAANQPECPDPEKLIWLQKLRERQSAIEKMIETLEKDN